MTSKNFYRRFFLFKKSICFSFVTLIQQYPVCIYNDVQNYIKRLFKHLELQFKSESLSVFPYYLVIIMHRRYSSRKGMTIVEINVSASYANLDTY